MSKTIRLLAVVWGCFAVWTLAGWFLTGSIERSVDGSEQRDGYEIWNQEPHLMAQIQLTGPWSQALREGYRAIDGYISGDNTTQSSIAMTLPVGIEREPESETIAVTAPVVQEEKNGQWLVSFVLPASYTSDTIPRPNDPRIRIVHVPAQRVAVLPFNGWIDQGSARIYQERIAGLLRRDKETIISPFRVVQYSKPWAPPFVQKNEIIVTIR